MASNSSDSDIRILLIGRTGHGKSSTGNTIVGRKVFEVCGASTSETKTCKWSEKYQRLGRTVEVVDTPGMFDTDQSNNAVHKELLKSLALCTPGFHAIAFVLKPDKFTEELQMTQDLFFEWFGDGVEKFACVILTNTDSEQAKDEYLNTRPHHKLTELVRKCNNIVIPLNNVADNEKTTPQVECLFQAVEKIKRNHGNQCFSNVAFKFAELYAMQKYPRRLTNESINILRDAGLPLELTPKRCRYLDMIFDISTDAERVDSSNSESESSVDSSNSESKSSASEADDSEVERETTNYASQSVGNVQIFDDISNEQIPNTVVKPTKIKTARPKKKVNAKGANEVPGKRNTYGSINCRDSEYICLIENEVDYGPANREELASDHIGSEPTSYQHGGASEEQDQTLSRKQPGRTRNTRKNRNIDIESVRYDPVDIFKDSVNNGDTELNGLFGYMRRAWRYCKRKSPCTLL